MASTRMIVLYKAASEAERARSLLRGAGFRSRVHHRPGDAGREGKRLPAWLLPGEAFVEARIPLEKTGSVGRMLRDATAVYSLFSFPDGQPISWKPATGSRGRAYVASRLAAAERAIAEARLRVRNAAPPETASHAVAEWGVAENASADTSPAEWLMDSWSVISNHAADVRRERLDEAFEGLPWTAAGSEPAPRAYSLAASLVAGSRGELGWEAIAKGAVPPRGEEPLHDGEIGVLVSCLKAAFIGYVAEQAVRIAGRQAEVELAAFWASRVATAARQGGRWRDLMEREAVTALGVPSAAVADILIERLRDEEVDAPAIREWLARSFDRPLAETLQAWYAERSAEQVALKNVSVSLKLLSQVKPDDLFLCLSRVEAVLAKDPAGAYAGMEAASRQRYREAVAELAEWGGMPGWEAAAAAVSAAEATVSGPGRHVGYYLVDDGRAGLERSLGIRPPAAERCRRLLRRRYAAAYFGAVGFLTASAAAATWLAVAAMPGVHYGTAIAATALAAFLWLDLAIRAVQLAVGAALPPSRLPVMDYAAGIPKRHAAAVVVPTLLLTPDSVASEFDRLEVKYLTDPDPNLRFGLLTDFSDAPYEVMPEDAELLDLARSGIDRLNAAYGEGRFFLFHRDRTYCESEGTWMGWERKRGKLEQFNGWLLTGTAVRGRLERGDAAAVRSSRYVITLDADTQLGIGSARRLVGAIAHPLNEAELSADRRSVRRGYAIIQPRVSTVLPSATASVFSRVFTQLSGVDPYTSVSADFYQDLTGEANYQGKGIYDPAVFAAVLGGRLPASRILSHDLLEGSYARTALASDIELFDQFPTSYASFSARESRWARGDWQLVEWLLPRVLTASGTREPNPLSAFKRWKIADNLRRSMMPGAATVAVLVGGFLLPFPLLEGLAVATYLFEPLSLGAMRPSALREREYGYAWLRSLVQLVMMPFMASLYAGSAAKALYRAYASRKGLLEWETAAEAHRKAAGFQRQFVLGLLWIPALAALALPSLSGARGSWLAMCLLCSWAAAPLLAASLQRVGGRKIRVLSGRLTDDERRSLRGVARRTWRYFTEFVDEEHRFLPPDNYQESVTGRVADRTSPTNVGLGLISVLAARDFGYATADEAVGRMAATLDSLSGLERYRGHFFNWYVPSTGDVLGDRFVSMVDSGNLAASLWAAAQGLRELKDAPCMGPEWLEGLIDSASLGVGLEGPAGRELLRASASHNAARLGGLLAAFAEAEAALAGVPVRGKWDEELAGHVGRMRRFIDEYAGWAEILRAVPAGGLAELGPTAHRWRRQALGTPPSPALIAGRNVPGLAGFLSLAASPDPGRSPAMERWLRDLSLAAERAQAAAARLVREIDRCAALADGLVEAMDFAFLYDARKRVFPIGYHVDERRFERSCYDMLASEARLGSLVAIAQGQVPVDHWWALGRRWSSYRGTGVLLSWSGTMFEYLMPVLLTRLYEQSLLDTACRAAVRAQALHAERAGIPWGISESGYAALDGEGNYQYFAFGSPGLGIRRGLGEELVVAPYATMLALMVDPQGAAANARRLSAAGLLGEYGYYEAIDYTRRNPSGKPGVTVGSYMAHHQGMSLVALGNALCGGAMQRRFHAIPRIKACESLLFEKAPEQAVPAATETEQPPAVSVRAGEPAPKAPNESVPTVSQRTAHFSNGAYRLAVSHRGGGYAAWRHFDLTRWRPDAVRDRSGQFVFIREHGGEPWSPTLDPLRRPGVERSQRFLPDRVEFKAAYGSLEAREEAAVSAEDPVEVRRVTVTNRGLRTRRIELTSYQELALASSKSEQSHPVFNGMFIQTGWVAGLGSLLAWRRPRSDADEPLYLIHTLVGADAKSVSHETDRKRFIGRGRTITDPAGLRGKLSGTDGFVLDPVFALRAEFVLRPGEHRTLSFLTAAADTRAEAVAVAERHRSAAGVERIFETAWAASQLALRSLNVSEATLQQSQQLASALMYRPRELRLPDAAAGGLPASLESLRGTGVSGDLPLVVVRASKDAHMPVVQEAVAAHSYLRLSGCAFDMVLLDEGGDPGLYARLLSVARARSYLSRFDAAGGIHVRSLADLGDREQYALAYFADVNVKAGRGSLGRYLLASAGYPTGAAPVRRADAASPASAVPDGPLFHNGVGGFGPDGSEYRFTAGGDRRPPRPWSNVIANRSLGVIVSDGGVGMTWHGNSQTNRLTPWSNDMVSDAPSEMLYLCDPDAGEFWTATPPQGTAGGEYDIAYGQGYASYRHARSDIEHELTLAVPVLGEEAPPVRLQRLRLRNRGSRPRRLALCHYVELVLGQNREDGRASTVTAWREEDGLLLARNPRRTAYSAAVAFYASSTRPEYHSGNRSSFFGDGGSLEHPAAVDAGRLDGAVGAGYDPCFATMLTVTLAPGEETEVCSVLGEAPSEEEAAALAAAYADAGAFSRALASTREWWRETLPTVRVHLPDAAAELMINHWLPYQIVSCRLWARSAFYQSGGAFGFRDQLQDVLSLLYVRPDLVRSQILGAAARQFEEGDVQHWWHADSGGGVRTRISDDLLWLPFAAARYAEVTGDDAVFSAVVPYLVAAPLEPAEDERYFVPETGASSYPLYDHCRRAIAMALSRTGIHGLPLIGTGDWNDGLSRVGAEGRGESVWLAWFLISVLDSMEGVASRIGAPDDATTFAREAARLREAVEMHAWDGAWYLRAFYDDGAALGSRLSSENVIDSLSQSWSVIAGGTDTGRQRQAMEAVLERLVRQDPPSVLLFTPPYEKTPHDPGYIKGYPPGVRENGGQYTHGSLWVPLALARMGSGSEAVRLLGLMNPVLSSDSPAKSRRYAVEPYVTAADVYALPGRDGEGGWTWYTGSAGWMYQIWVEEVLGLKLRGDAMTVDPVIPKDWTGFAMTYRYKGATYDITVENPDGVESGVARLICNGGEVERISLAETGTYKVRVVMG